MIAPTACVDEARCCSLESVSFDLQKMSSMACQFAPASLSCALDEGVPVLLRDGVLLRVERPNGPFSRSRRAPRSGLEVTC